MKILVTGAGGMLGSKVVQEGILSNHHMIPMDHSALDITSELALEFALEKYKPDIVINCAGIVKGRIDVGKKDFFNVNVYASQHMGRLCRDLNIKMVQISTDCVFKGDGPHYEEDKPNAKDDYGKSKAEGEVNNGKSITIRLSFIGIGKRGLLSWLKKQEGEVPGWINVQWNGLTVKYAAREIIKLAIGDNVGIWHLYGQDTTKYEVLSAANDVLGLGLKIRKVNEPIADYRLYTQRSNPAVPVTILRQLEEMVDAYCSCSCGSESCL